MGEPVAKAARTAGGFGVGHGGVAPLTDLENGTAGTREEGAPTANVADAARVSPEGTTTTRTGDDITSLTEDAGALATDFDLEFLTGGASGET